MSAPVTQAHRDLCREIINTPFGSRAQLIADSEAQAVADLQCSFATVAVERTELRKERDQLRAVFPQICAALGNGACCTPDVSIGFIQSIPNEVASVVAKLRAEVERFKTYGAAELAAINPNVESYCKYWEARAERAEASLHALRLVCGTTDADKFSTWVDRANARAEKAEAELKRYTDAVDAQPWATDEPIRVLLDRITLLWSSERQAKVERGDMLCECQAALAVERARLDHILKLRCEDETREQIDAAMKEGAP